MKMGIREKIREMQERGQNLELVTVIETDGSVPGKKGAQMLVGKNGYLFGTVGGGALEYLAERQALDLLKARKSLTRCFRLREQGEEATGMACGGNVTLQFEFLQYGKGEEKERLDREPDRREQVILFGGGHIAAALMPLLIQTDFRVMLYDDRPEYAAPERFPEAEALICAPYTDVLKHVSPGKEAYIVVLTESHRYDFEVLEQLLREDFAYIGVIGSKHKTSVVNERLRTAGISEEKVGQLHAPIGLPIHSQTPQEIAVSITAELILCRAERRLWTEKQ